MPSRPADQAEHDDGADAETAAADRNAETAAAAAAAAAVIAIVLDIVAAAEIIPTHFKLLPWQWPRSLPKLVAARPMRP